ncbi:hypothetical protein MLD38_014281 [Melastoma candidum]|uniref:Uncharacterized protein n=1 Tax=Melastoma candidum TaxID=119954 RepID=A0ACB9RBM6_9MYRT|nr:hypothetical protein MLD38_014281 [Melastoma candidum]
MALSLAPLPQTSSFHYSRHSLRLPFRHNRTRTTQVGFAVCCSERQASAALVEDVPGTRPGDAEAPGKVVYRVKKRRKPRPSFLDLIQDKWSVKIGSKREKFPWEEEDKLCAEEKRPPQLWKREAVNDEGIGEGDKEGVPMTVETREVVKEEGTEEGLEEEVAVSTASQDKRIFAPWVHGSGVAKLQVDSSGVALTGTMLGPEDKDDGDEEVVVQEAHLDVQVVSDVELDGNENSVGSILSSGNEGIVSEDERTELGGLFKEFLSNDDADYDPGVNVGFREDKLGGNINGKGVIMDLPWRREAESDGGSMKKKKRSNSELAERIIPEHELKRLRELSLRMFERIKIGNAGVTQELVDSIHWKWRLDEVVKLKFEGAPSHNMRRTQEILEDRTGGLVIYRSGSLVVLYRGMAYKLPCVQSYNKQADADSMTHPRSAHLVQNATPAPLVKEILKTERPLTIDSLEYLSKLSKKELMDMNNLNALLNELGPRYTDWSGREPIPVDADLLPPEVPGYRPPFRLLLQGVRHALRDKEMTTLRQTARTMPPHFALGRNRKLQGLANAMVKLWETSAIAKIAIKRGVVNTCNDRMAEELKILTGGTLLSRNKEYIVFYRGNDFLPPRVLLLRHRLLLLSGEKRLTSEDIQQMRRDDSFHKHESLLSHLKRKLALAIRKVKKAEITLAKVQEKLMPAELPSDLEIISDEERFLFRKVGLSMKPFLHVGRREVFDGTIENIHLHWKHRELVKLIVRGKSFAQVKHIAISLEAESGGVLISVDRTTKGYAIILYRGKNYQRPIAVRPRTLLTRRQALARSIELQRREALKHHLSELQERIELIKTELKEMRKNNEIDAERVSKSLEACSSISEFSEGEGEEAYLKVYESGGEDSGADDDHPVQ